MAGTARRPRSPAGRRPGQRSSGCPCSGCPGEGSWLRAPAAGRGSPGTQRGRAASRPVASSGTGTGCVQPHEGSPRPLLGPDALLQLLEAGETSPVSPQGHWGGQGWSWTLRLLPAGGELGVCATHWAAWGVWWVLNWGELVPGAVFAGSGELCLAHVLGLPLASQNHRAWLLPQHTCPPPPAITPGVINDSGTQWPGLITLSGHLICSPTLPQPAPVRFATGTRAGRRGTQGEGGSPQTEAVP